MKSSQMVKCGHGHKSTCKRYGSQTSRRFAEGNRLDTESIGIVGRYHPVGSQRVDLLGDQWKNGRDERHPHQESALKNERWHASPVLLGRLPASVKLKVKISQGVELPGLMFLSSSRFINASAMWIPIRCS